jgi:hypothetical protein
VPDSFWTVSLETVWKIERGRTMTYAPGHESSYSTDLSDAEWGCIEPHVPPPNGRWQGVPREALGDRMAPGDDQYLLTPALVGL